MYPPSKFSSRDPAEALAIAGETKFATVVAATGDGLITVHVPWTPVDGEGDPAFVGHVLRANPLVQALASGPIPARLIFQPAQGYVSPGVYAEKPRSGKVVPTWNYVAAHFDGVLSVEDDAETLMGILGRQVADYEGAVGGDWALEDAPADFLATMAQGIVGVSFRAEGWLAIGKLSQNRPEDLRAVTRWLEETRPAAADIGYWMRRTHGDP
jgi:transcriptional regulator